MQSTFKCFFRWQKLTAAPTHISTLASFLHWYSCCFSTPETTIGTLIMENYLTQLHFKKTQPVPLSFDLFIHSRDCDCDVLEFHAVRIAVKSVLGFISFFLPFEVLLKYDCISQATCFTSCDSPIHTYISRPTYWTQSVDGHSHISIPCFAKPSW